MDTEWYKQRKLEDLQVQIVQMALDEKDIQNILWSLVRSDWENIWANDRVSCDGCDQSIHRREIAYTENYRNFCTPCALKEEKRICERCWGTFHVKTCSFIRTCPLCHSSICQVCKKATLGQSISKIRIVCLSCQTALSLGDDWEKRELRKLSAHQSRCQEGYISFREWVTTLQDFTWKCAYCRLGAYEQLDHFIPVCKGGHNSIDNCVPTCKACNDAKGQKLPSKVSSIPKDALNRVQTYLQTR